MSILTAICPGGPGLAGTRMSPFWILLDLRVMEIGDGGNNWSYRHAKLQSKCHHEQTNTVFYTLDACLSPNRQCESHEMKYCIIFLDCLIYVDTVVCVFGYRKGTWPVENFCFIQCIKVIFF